MDALLMCGGRGTRLDAAVEKPLVEVAGEPMVDRVTTALLASRIDTIYAVVSPHTPETYAHLEPEFPCIETPGEGYVSDLGVALEHVEQPVLTVAADLPLLAGEVIDWVLDAGDGATSVAVLHALKTTLGVSIEYDQPWVPSGVNIVAPGDDTVVRSWDARLAVNVNRKQDVAVAERLLHDGS